PGAGAPDEVLQGFHLRVVRVLVPQSDPVADSVPTDPVLVVQPGARRQTTIRHPVLGPESVDRVGGDGTAGSVDKQVRQGARVSLLAESGAARRLWPICRRRPARHLAESGAMKAAWRLIAAGVVCALLAVPASAASGKTLVVFTVDVESNETFQLPDQLDAMCKDGSACGLMEIA